MKNGRYILAALTVAIVALVILFLTRQSPVESPALPDSPESPAAQKSKAITNPLTRGKKPAATAEAIAGNAAITTNPPFSNVSVSVTTENSPSSDLDPAAETPAAGPAAHPATVRSSFSQGPTPPTPVPPTPLELFRTNTPEKPPGQGRSPAGP
jgi:hypothetical protein